MTFIGDVSLHLESGFTLVLNNTLYVPSFRRNLISIPLLDKLGYYMNFGNSEVKLSLNYTNIGYGVLIDGLYKLCNTHFKTHFIQTISNMWKHFRSLR